MRVIICVIKLAINVQNPGHGRDVLGQIILYIQPQNLGYVCNISNAFMANLVFKILFNCYCYSKPNVFKSSPLFLAYDELKYSPGSFLIVDACSIQCSVQLPACSVRTLLTSQSQSLHYTRPPRNVLSSLVVFFWILFTNNSLLLKLFAF